MSTPFSTSFPTEIFGVGVMWGQNKSMQFAHHKAFLGSPVSEQWMGDGPFPGMGSAMDESNEWLDCSCVETIDGNEVDCLGLRTKDRAAWVSFPLATTHVPICTPNEMYWMSHCCVLWMNG